MLDALHLLPGDDRAAKLLQVKRGAVDGGDGANFVAGQNGVEDFALLEAGQKLGEKAGAEGAFGIERDGGVEEVPGVFGHVEVVAELAAVVFGEKIELLFGGVERRSEFLEAAKFQLERGFGVL